TAFSIWNGLLFALPRGYRPRKRVSIRRGKRLAVIRGGPRRAGDLPAETYSSGAEKWHLLRPYRRFRPCTEAVPMTKSAAPAAIVKPTEIQPAEGYRTRHEVETADDRLYLRALSGSAGAMETLEEAAEEHSRDEIGCALCHDADGMQFNLSLCQSILE